MLAQRGGGGNGSNPFATSALEGSVWLAPRSGCFTPIKTRYQLYGRLGGPEGWSGRVRKAPPRPSEFDPRTVTEKAAVGANPRFVLRKETDPVPETLCSFY